MWIVELALRRPYAVAVFCLFLCLSGLFAATRMRTDVLPVVDIPVVVVIWNYPGLPAEDIEKRIVQGSERGYSMTVNGISRLESRSVAGVGIVKLYFEAGADMGMAIAQVNSVSSTILRTLPPGTTPPIVLPYNAGNVPVAQLTVTGTTHGEEELVDYSVGVRLRLFTIPGLTVPPAYGGKWHQINIDVDPAAAAARGVATDDVLRTVLESNPNLPGATAFLDSNKFDISINNNPASLDELRSSLVKMVSGVPVRLGDVANVYDGTERQESVVRVDGRRAAYLALVRKSNGSTIAVVDAARSLLPLMRESAPEGVELKLDFDQSVFVRAAIANVIREAVFAALLVTALIFIVLGSWRAAVVVATSIPLAGCAALVGLHLFGETLNLMTLGGLALAVGMLVDDAIVEVENIHRQLRLGKPLRQAIVDGAREIAMPALASTLTICVVFAPVVLLKGPAHFLFVPLALAVVFAMLASYVLSRTLVPTLTHALFRGSGDGQPAGATRERSFARLRRLHERSLRAAMGRKGFVLACTLLAFALVGSMLLVVGATIFPEVDSGRMRLHVRAPLGTKLEDTERLLDRVEKRIREIIPPSELEGINSLVGLPSYFNLAFAQTDNIGPHDADLVIALRPGHRPTAWYRSQLRRVLPEDFPQGTFYFQSADVISQVLDFGASSQIDVRIEGRKLEETTEIARELAGRLRLIPGTADVRIAQPSGHPSLRLRVDRDRAGLLGVSQRGVASGLVTSLNSSTMVAPSYWMNPETNTTYLVSVQAPPLRLRGVDDLLGLPIPFREHGSAQTGNAGTTPLANVASVDLSRSSAMVSRENAQRVVNVQSNTEGRDLAAVTSDVKRAVAAMGPPPKGVTITVGGASANLADTFGSLQLGLVVAALLAYLLMVVLFQSWIDPLVVMVAVPGALAGVVVALVVTETTLNVESFMGSILAIGLATANSILLVSFAGQLQRSGHTSIAAAIEAAGTRLRPVLLTATAMGLGMLPMAIGAGEGGEQNAPLGRAVIGGLVGATLTTLWIVPLVYAVVRHKHKGEGVIAP